MNLPLKTHTNLAAYAFSKKPGFDELTVRKEFAKAAPLRTVVISLRVGDDVAGVDLAELPSDNRRNVDNARVVAKVATTTTLFEVVVAGGRAIDALRSITVAQHLFGIKNIVIVHHTYCGATSFTTDGIVDAWKLEHDADISAIYERGSISISDFGTSLEARHPPDERIERYATTCQHLRLPLQHRHQRVVAG